MSTPRFSSVFDSMTVNFPAGGRAQYHGNLWPNLEIMKAKIAQKHQNIILITGRTGTGKSELAWQIGKFLDPHGFSLDNIFWDTDSLIKVAASKEDIKPPGTVFIFDEAREGTQSLNAMSETNRRMGLFLDTVRSRGYHILLLQPDYFFFQLSIAIMASDLLIHVEKEGNEEFHQQLIEGKRYGEVGNEITASPFIRGNGRIYNFDQKKKLYIKGKKMRDMDINRDYSVFSFSKSSGIVDQDEYDRRKNLAVAKMNDAFEKETEPKLNPRAEKVLHFKQKAFYLLHSRYGMTTTQIAKYFDVTLPEVSQLVGAERKLLETDFNLKPSTEIREPVYENPQYEFIGDADPFATPLGSEGNNEDSNKVPKAPEAPESPIYRIIPEVPSKKYKCIKCNYQLKRFQPSCPSCKSSDIRDAQWSGLID